MIEAFKDMKHGKSSSYEGLALERTANQILHRMEDQSNGDSLESARARVLGWFAPPLHNPTPSSSSHQLYLAFEMRV